jgi:hypothetical protein
VGSSLKDAFRILLDKIGFYPKWISILSVFVVGT